MHAIAHAADVQDRDGGVLLMATLFGLYPFLLKLYADGGYQGAQFQDALGAILKRVNVEIVKRSDQAQRFVVLPKRWIVERTFAWLGRCRRLAKDWECLNRKALAFLKLASIRLMTRKLCNSRGCFRSDSEGFEASGEVVGVDKVAQVRLQLVASFVEVAFDGRVLDGAVHSFDLPIGLWMPATSTWRLRRLGRFEFGLLAGIGCARTIADRRAWMAGACSGSSFAHN